MDSRVCLSSGSRSPVTPGSFTGLWKDSSWGGEEAAVFPALPAGEETENAGQTIANAIIGPPLSRQFKKKQTKLTSAVMALF